MTYRQLVMTASIFAFSIGSIAVFSAERATAHELDSETYEAYTLIHAGHVMAVPGEDVLKDHTIIIHEGKIVGVESGFLDDNDATIIDGKDRFYLPGLIDSHVHLRGEWNPNGRLETFTKEDSDVAFDAAHNAKTTLMAGFTAVQDVGGPPSIKALSRYMKPSINLALTSCKPWRSIWTSHPIFLMIKSMSEIQSCDYSIILPMTQLHQRVLCERQNMKI